MSNWVIRIFIICIGFLLSNAAAGDEDKKDNLKKLTIKERQLCREQKREVAGPYKTKMFLLKKKIKIIKARELDTTKQYKSIKAELKALRKSKEEAMAKLDKEMELKNQIKELRNNLKDSPDVKALNNQVKQLREEMREAVKEVECGWKDVK